MSFKSPIKLKILPGSAVRQTPPRNVSPAKKREITVDPIKEFSPYFQDLDLLLEYKLLYDNHSPGVYVLPSFKSMHEWHGVVFVRSGPYRRGIFKFIIYIPDNFPMTRPMLKFKSRVVHPLIHEVNGRFNLLRKFPAWEPHKDHIWHILAYMKECLEDPLSQEDDPLEEPEQTKKSFKPIKDKDFVQDARQCVKESLNELFTTGGEEEDDYHSIQFKKTTDEVFKRAQELIHAGDISVFQRESQSKEGSGLLSGFAQQITTFLDSMITR